MKVGTRRILLGIVVGVLSYATCSGKRTTYPGELSADQPFAPIEIQKSTVDRALREAKAGGRILMVEFGADWCGDCRQLASSLRQSPTREKLRHFTVLKVDVGEFTRNLGIAKYLGVDVQNRGIPAVVFMTPEMPRRYGTQSILEFLHSAQ